MGVMRSLGEIFGFERPEGKKGMELQTQTSNKYLEQAILSMLNGTDMNLNNSSRSFVEDGYGANIAIYSIINYIITTASNVPFKVQVMDSDTWVDDPGSDLLKLINKPNPYATYSLFIEETLGWKFLDGAYYVYAPRLENGANAGKALEMWTMPSTDMQVIGGNIRKPIEGFKYTAWQDTIPIEDVLYGRYFNPVGAINKPAASFTGMSPLRAAVLTAQKSNSAAVAAAAAYENNGAMGIVSKDGGQFSDFSEQSAKNIEEAWSKRNGGANNYGKLAFTPGQIKYDRLNMSPADLRLAESELASMRQMAGVYKFPSQLLNDSAGATFSNQKEAQKSVYTNTIIPEMRGLGEGLANWLGEAYYPSEVIRVIPDTTNIEVLQEDKAALAGWLNGVDFMTQNEKRKEMGLDEDPNPQMDDYLIPNNKTRSEDLNMLGDLNDFSDTSEDNE